MAVAMVYTIVADVVPVEERTDMFFRLVALVLIFNVIFNPISAWLLQYDPWLSMWIGFGFMVFGTLCILLIPETMHLRRKDDERHEHADVGKSGVLRQAWFSIKNDMQHVWRFIFASKSIMMLMFAVALFYPTRITLTGPLLQYMSKRFNWSWSKVSHLLRCASITDRIGYICIDDWHHRYGGVLSHHPTHNIRFSQQVSSLQITPHRKRSAALAYLHHDHGRWIITHGRGRNTMGIRHFSHHRQHRQFVCRAEQSLAQCFS